MLVIFFTCVFIILIILLMNMLIKISNTKLNKMSTFECGFEPFSQNRPPFSLRYFKIIVIFLIFDIEIILMLPMPLATDNIFNFYLYSLIIITIITGLLIEIFQGALKWLNP